MARAPYLQQLLTVASKYLRRLRTLRDHGIMPLAVNISLNLGRGSCCFASDATDMLRCLPQVSSTWVLAVVMPYFIFSQVKFGSLARA